MSATRPGSTAITATLNQLDWRSAYGTDSDSNRRKGLRLSPGTYTVRVGVDINMNGALDPEEYQQTCNLFAPLADLRVDSNNDDTIGSNDEPQEYAFPGKIIWADKDLYWQTGSNDSDVVEMKINFDMGGRVVPQGCYFLLQWFGQTNTTDNMVDVFLDSTCTNPLARTGWHPVYSNTCRTGHLFDVGDTVPERVYLRASTNALRPTDTSKYMTHFVTTILLTCYRLDTKSSVFSDGVRVSICDRPAVTPKNDLFYTWIEEVTSPARFDYIKQIWEAVSNDMSGAGYHSVPYRHKFYRTTDNNCDPSNFVNLGQAGILVTSMHGPPGGGSVLPVAFPHTDDGWSNAVVWANQLNTEFSYVDDLGGTNAWYVFLNTPFFTTAWKPQRDANNAILLASVCYSATGTPTFIASAGGAFCCGNTMAMTIGGDMMQDGERLYKSMATKMRDSTWRTAYGAFAQMCTNAAYKTAGHGRVTLWPALLNANDAAFPSSFIGPTGTITTIFDTTIKEQPGAMTVLGRSPDLRLRNADLRWISSNGSRCGLCWPYSGDALDYATNSFRIVADRCVAEPWTVGMAPKKFAGDGFSCGKNYDWGF